MRITLLAVLAAVIAIFAIPATASAAMGVTGFSVAPDTTVKGANPNLTVSFTRTGSSSDDLRDSALHLPNGLQYSIAGVTTKCSTTQFQLDACPSASIVGTTTANGTLTLLGAIKFNGTMYGTVYARSNGQIGTIYRPSGFPKVVFSSSLYTSTLTGGVQIKAQNWPRTLSFLGLVPLEVTIGMVRTRYQAKSGSGGTGQIVIKNPTTCGPALSKLVLTPYTGANVQASSSYNVTGCTAVDTTPPVVSAVNPATGTTTGASSIVLTYTATDDSGVAPTCTPASGTTIPLSVGTNSVVISCTDGSGNTTNVPLTYFRTDSVPPVISAISPADGTSTTDSSVVLTYTATDNSGVAPTCSPASGSTISLSVGTTPVEITCTDGSGNSVTETVTYTRTVPDTTPPTVAITSPVDGSSTTDASTTVEYTSSDDSGVAPTCTPASGSSVALALGSNTITVTCTDGSSNSASASVSVTRLDNEAPAISITSPVDGSTTNAASTTLVYTATDNSGAAPTCSPASGSSQALAFGSNTISVTCTDGSSNSTTESVSVTRVDDQGPSISITSPVDGSSTTDASTTVEYTASDNSGDTPTCSPASGSSQALSFGSNTISVTCTDSSSNSTTESVSVTRLDVDPPSLDVTSPVDGSTTTDASVTVLYTASDNSGDAPTCTPASGSSVALSVGLNTITVTCDDSSGNTASQSVSVTRVDNEAPVITITSPADNSSTTASSTTIEYTVTDNSGDAPTCSPASGSSVALSFGSNTIDVTCTDGSGNSSTESVTVNRNDVGGPQIDITSPVDGSSTTAASVTLTYTATDDSGIAPTCSPASGSSQSLVFGSNTISVTCTDNSSNSTTESVSVTRVDDEGPVISITSPVDGSTTTSATTAVEYTVTDNSGVAPTCNFPNPGTSLLVVGLNTISVTCTDGSGNSTTESASITRIDNEAPVITITSPVDGSTTTDATTTLSYTATDNSGDAPSCSPASGSVIPLTFGSNTISVTCTDGSSNSSTESVSVTRLDVEAPSISISSPVDGSSTTDASVTLTYTATDNSGAAPSCGPPSGSSVALDFGVNTISVTCTDGSSNSATQSVTVTRLDNVAPSITITSPVDGSSTTDASVTLSYTATDNSGDAPSCSPASGSSVALDFGVNTISVTCTDGSSNSTTESVTVTRLDNEAPSVTITSPVDGSSTADASATLTYTATDNSGVAPSCTPASGSSQPLAFGSNTLSVTCTDGSSNSTTESVSVTRLDVEAPSITITSPVDGSSTTDASVTLSYTATDNSGAAPSCGPPSGSSVALDFGVNTISVTCTDGSSNSSTESVLVTRLDNVAPSITITSPVDGSTTTAASAVLSYTATDNSGVAPSCSPASGSSQPLAFGSNTLSVTCTDGSSNSTTESVSVTRLDVEAPSISISSPVDGSSTADATTTLAYTATDNSGVAPSCSPATASVIPLAFGSNTISVTCTDGSSNSTTESVSVTRNDVDGPEVTITSPVDGSSTTDASVTLTYTATDNSGAAPSCGPPSGSSVALDFGVNTISVTCTDGSSNSTTESVSVTRLDNVAPSITITSPVDGSSTTDSSVTLTYTATDNSGDTPSCSPASGSSVALSFGSNTIAVTCTDGSSNSATESVTVTRLDNTPPVITITSPVDGSSTADASATLTYTATDNSGVAPSCTPASGSSQALVLGSNTLSVTCTDGSSNSSTESVSVTRLDVEAPSISITSPVDGSSTTDASVTLTYTATDNSGAAPSCGPPSGSSVALDFGVNTISVTCTDGSSNSRTESVTVTRLDNVAPSITITSPVDGSSTTDSSVTLTYTATDNSGVAPSCSPASGSSVALSLGSNTISVTCTDGSSNSATESVSVTRLDNTPPVITITSPVDGSSTTDASATLTYTATDDSGVAPSCTPASGSSQALVLGSNTLSVTCTDGSSNSSTESVSVTRLDNTPPVITITSPVDGSSTTDASATLTYTATDNSGVAPSCTPASGSSQALAFGSNTISVTCTDGSSNSSTESVTVTRVDDVAPVISDIAPPNGFSTEDPSVVLTYTATDNSGDAPTCSPASGSTIPLAVGPNVVVISCEDASSNVATETVTYTRTESEPIPNTTIDTYGAPSAQTTSTIDISASSDVPTATFECRMNNEAFAPCTSIWTLPLSSDPSIISPGQNTYDVRAVTGAGPDPTPARGYIWVDDRPFYATASVTPEPNSLVADADAANDAGAHPNVTANLQVEGYDDPQSVTIQFPDGLMGSLAAVPEANRCQLADAQVGNCPSSAAIGTMTGTAVGPVDGTVTATGTVYLVDAAGLDAQYAAGLSVDFEDITGPVSGNVGDIYATAGLRLNDQARNLVVDIPSIPNATYANASSPGGMPFHITEVSLTVNGDTGGASNPLITNPHFCNDAGEPFDARPNFQNFVGSGVGYYGSTTGDITVPYVVDNCVSVPFNPSLSLSLTDPTAGSSTGINATVSLPAENSTLRGVQVRLPSFIALNFPSFGVASDMCSGADDGSGSANNVSPEGTTPAYYSFDASSCPPQARIGTAILTTPLLDQPVTGYVYLIDKAPVPWLGISVTPDIPGNPQGVNIGLVGFNATPQEDPGCVSGCQLIVQSTFSSAPDVPVSSIELSLGGITGRISDGPGNPELNPNILNIAGANASSCRNSGTQATADFNPWTGTGIATVVSPLTISGCNDPKINITSPAVPTTGSRINNVSNTTATSPLNFTVNGSTTIPGDVSCDINGTPTSSTSNTVSLVTGVNNFVVTCTDAFGSGTATRRIDKGIPSIRFTAPTAASTTLASINTTLAVNANGALLSGTLPGSSGTTCNVNGINISSLSTAISVPLTLGLNTLTATCTNSFGTGTTVTTITRN